jgi:hypothetical protein
MKPLLTSLLFLASFSTSGLAVAETNLVDSASMDRIVTHSSQEIRLAQRHHHPGRGSGRHHSGRHSRHNWVAPLVAGALIGAIIANSNSQPQFSGKGAYRSAKRRCARDYRSYDWDSDTFVTYSGVVKLCPHVREYYR